MSRDDVDALSKALSATDPEADHPAYRYRRDATEVLDALPTGWHLTNDDPGVMQDDMAELMKLLGISTHARPVSPHRVMVDEIIPAVRALVRIAHVTLDP